MDLVYDYENCIPTFSIKSNEYKGRKPEVFKMIDNGIVRGNNYIISSYGRVFNSKTEHELHKILRDQYGAVMLRNIDNEEQEFYIHELVAEAFILEYKNQIKEDPSIKLRHINGIRSCNYVENMAVTMSYNESHTKVNKDMMVYRT